MKKEPLGKKVMMAIWGVSNALIQVRVIMPKGRGRRRGTTVSDLQYIMIDGELKKKNWRSYFHGLLFNKDYENLNKWDVKLPGFVDKKIKRKSDGKLIEYGTAECNDLLESLEVESKRLEHDFLTKHKYLIVDFTDLLQKGVEVDVRDGIVLKCDDCETWVTIDPANQWLKHGDKHEYCSKAGIFQQIKL